MGRAPRNVPSSLIRRLLWSSQTLYVRGHGAGAVRSGAAGGACVLVDPVPREHALKRRSSHVVEVEFLGVVVEVQR